MKKPSPTPPSTAVRATPASSKVIGPPTSICAVWPSFSNCQRYRAQSYAGRPAIGAWWREAKTKPLGMTQEGDVTKVRPRLTGQFPGSPALLTFSFRLEGQQIVALAIT